MRNLILKQNFMNDQSLFLRTINITIEQAIKKTDKPIIHINAIKGSPSRPKAYGRL